MCEGVRERKTVLRAMCLCLLLLLASVPAVADPVVTNYFTVDVPDNWQLMQQSEASGIFLCIFSTKSRDVTLTLAVSSSSGADVKTIAESFALQYKAKKSPVVKNGQATFSYENFEGLEGFAYVTLHDDVYMVAAVEGNIPRGRDFLRHFRSDAFASLIPNT